MRKKIKDWVLGQVALKLDAEPFSSLPRRMRLGIFLLAASFVVSYAGPVVALFAGVRGEQLLASSIIATALYAGGWIIGAVGLVLAGKDSIRYPVYFTAKALYVLAPSCFSEGAPAPRPPRRSPFFIATCVAALVLAGAFATAAAIGNWKILLVVGITTVVCHQGLYLYGMFSPGADFFFVSLRGKDLPMDPDGVLFRFDDGPDEQYTPVILDLLRDHGQRAIFAVTGENVLRCPQLVRRMHEEGHIIANHTFTHSHCTLFFTYRRLLAEMTETNRAIHAVAGSTPVYFCPPVGFTNPVMGRAQRALGLMPLMWDVRSLDTQLPTERIVARVRKQLAPGKILLFHDAVLPPGRADRSATVEAVRILCAELRKSAQVEAGKQA